ncbi:hypothetical protein [Rhizobium mesoamericanum]|uniref:Uncharacterized protein n=1 Tax=Rhizobium mesoamericanum STM3625 TaxID=1211777 RepID=K0PZZ1_9HYPH|nr:hypothetical protein [Rhizobium mesoamericanum]CCM77127.1 hypothetical protein BN77_4175 [Rhizobium mesoamericanum STM3625]
MTGSSKQTTTTTNNQPWSGAQPALGQALGGAQDLVNRGIGTQIYTGNTFAPASQGSVMAAEASGSLGSSNVNGKGLSGQYQGIINNGGFNSAQLGALKNTQDLANSTWSVSPELQKIIDQTNADANTNVSLANSAGGRYGSGAGNAAIADAVSKNTNNLLYNDLNNFNSRKDAANANAFNMGSTGFGQLGSAYTGMQAPIQNLAQWGQFVDDYNTKELNDKLRIFNESQTKPWEQISRLNAIASGAGQLGGTTTQSQPGQNPFLTALGYGLTGAGLLGSF